MAHNHGQSSYFYQNPFGARAGASLEHIVLNNSKQYFKSYNNYQNLQNHSDQAAERWKHAAEKIGKEIRSNNENNEAEDIGDEDSRDCCSKKWCWWNPSANSIIVAFCADTSIHGLKFMGQQRRHMSERIFWLIAFCFSLGAAIYLIYEVWDKYKKSPVIVSFQSDEQDIDSIPFPAVTLCNMNKFPISKVRELERIIDSDPSSKAATEAKQQLTFVKSVCNAEISFAKEFKFAYQRGKQKDYSGANESISEDNQDDMMDFLLNNTLPCDELVRLCILGEARANCSDLFRPIITDYGKCCVFNIMPLPLLLNNPQHKDDGKNESLIYKNPALGNFAEKNWPYEDIIEWRKWDYDDGFVLKNKDLKHPWRQRRAGLPYGLSILIDPNTDEYFCPVSDSEGIKYILHTPLEMPHVMEFASVADLNKEILIEVHPDMTNADDGIRKVEHAKRQCYFGKEKDLKFFGPYTGGNCIDECTAIVLADKCNCTFFFMPRDDNVRICNNDPGSADFICIESARVDLQATLKQKCGHCDTLCEDIAYNYETTIATLQNNSKLWGDPDPNKKGIPHWANHKMSVIHIFFGSETTVPKYRKRLYGPTDLIANTGGILGLCLGFSILSGVEVIYFATMRVFWKLCWRRLRGRRIAGKFIGALTASNNARKVINVNPQNVPIYNGYQQNYGYGAIYGNQPGYY